MLLVIFQIWLFDVNFLKFKPVNVHHKTEIDYD